MAAPDGQVRMYTENDPDMPEEFRRFLIKLLKYEHVENNGNPQYRALLADIANAGLRYAPDGRSMLVEAEIVRQEVQHGEIVANLIRGLGEDPEIDQPIKQYAFHIPMECWTDLSWFHGLIDRVGLYVGIEWMGSTYEPLSMVSPQLEKDEHFHAATGMKYLERIVRDPAGRAEAQELLHKWWPAALDMFGRSDSVNSEIYVKWGIKARSNEELRQQYIAETVPLIEKLGLEVPDNLANRRFL